MQYHKIDSIYKRDERGRFLIGQWSRPEFEYLANCPWDWTEKVDGTNIRLLIGETDYEIRGKSDAAMIPPALIEAVRAALPWSAFEGKALAGTIIYGEGYGWKIQKVGHRYSPTPQFIVFDVRVGEYWLERGAVHEIAQSLGLRCVGQVGTGTLAEAVEAVKSGMLSWCADDLTLPGEGLVLRPAVRLLDASARRIITKIKAKDFQ